MTASAARRARARALKTHLAVGTYVPRVARESKGTTSCGGSSAQRWQVEAYSDHSEGDTEPATARYIRADKLEDASIGHGT